MAAASAVRAREPNRKPERLRALDGLRGIAILLVLTVHLHNMEVLPQDWLILRKLSGPMALGWIGVDLFFVLSGFLITGILLDTKEAPNRALSFYGRRVLRIFPLYYAVLIGVFIIGTALYPFSYALRLDWPSPIAWASYYLYIQNWWMPLREVSHLSLLGHLWSLAVEEQFYLLWPWCVWFVPRSKLFGICFVGIFAALGLRFACEISPSLQTSLFIYMNTFTRMDTLLIGGLCALVFRDAHLLNKTARFAPLVALSTALGFLLTIWLSGEKWEAKFYTQTLGYSFVALAAGAIVLLAAYQRERPTLLARILRSGALTLFGKYSYGIYVYQSLIEYAVLRILGKQPWWGHSLKWAALMTILWLLLPLLVAMASFRWLENPFLHMKSGFKAQFSLAAFDSTR